jgi:hypothetical protein
MRDALAQVMTVCGIRTVDGLENEGGRQGFALQFANFKALPNMVTSSRAWSGSSLTGWPMPAALAGKHGQVMGSQYRRLLEP